MLSSGAHHASACSRTTNAHQSVIAEGSSIHSRSPVLCERDRERAYLLLPYQKSFLHKMARHNIAGRGAAAAVSSSPPVRLLIYARSSRRRRCGSGAAAFFFPESPPRSPYRFQRRTASITPVGIATAGLPGSGSNTPGASWVS